MASRPGRRWWPARTAERLSGVSARTGAQRVALFTHQLVQRTAERTCSGAAADRHPAFVGEADDAARVGAEDQVLHALIITLSSRSRRAPPRPAPRRSAARAARLSTRLRRGEQGHGPRWRAATSAPRRTGRSTTFHQLPKRRAGPGHGTALARAAAAGAVGLSASGWGLAAADKARIISINISII